MLNKYIDHTILNADALKKDFENIVKEAIDNEFYSVCINPYYIDRAKEMLQGTDVKVCTVIGFPLGQNTTQTKVFEAKDAVSRGADELDMVINVAALKDNDQKYVYNEIKQIRDSIPQTVVLKVILETCLLTDEEIAVGAQLCAKAGANFVKTSTGFSTGGATVKAINIIKENVPANVKIKASGGIRDAERAKLMIDSGAARIGASKSVSIVQS